MAQTASHNVIAGRTRNWHQRRACAASDPASRTQIVTTELDRKIRKALAREVRRLKISLNLRFVRLYLGKFFLSCRSARLNALNYLSRGFGYARFE